MAFQNFTLDVDADGIALVTWDMPGRTMNLIDFEMMDELGKVVEQVANDAAVKGVVVTSGKDTFCGGADLTMLNGFRAGYEEILAGKGEEAAAAMVFEQSRKLSQLYRRLETSGKPWVAAINGSAFGGGFSSASPATTGSLPTIPRPASASPRSRSACSRAPAERSASRA